MGRGAVVSQATGLKEAESISFFYFFYFFFYFTYLPWEISVITGFHYLPANKYNGDVVLHIQNNTKLNDGVMR